MPHSSLWCPPLGTERPQARAIETSGALDRTRLRSFGSQRGAPMEDIPSGNEVLRSDTVGIQPVLRYQLLKTMFTSNGTTAAEAAITQQFN